MSFPDSGGDRAQVQDGGVALAALDRADEGAVQAAALAQPLLGPAQPLGHEHQQRHADARGREYHVETQRQFHLAAGGRTGVHGIAYPSRFIVLC
jgi:hypothetical protein